MALSAAQLEQQKKQAEELLFSGPETLGFAKGLFFGHFNAEATSSRTRSSRPATQATVDQAVGQDAAVLRRADRPCRHRPGKPTSRSRSSTAWPNSASSA